MLLQRRHTAGVIGWQRGRTLALALLSALGEAAAGNSMKMCARSGHRELCPKAQPAAGPRARERLVLSLCCSRQALRAACALPAAAPERPGR